MDGKDGAAGIVFAREHHHHLAFGNALLQPVQRGREIALDFLALLGQLEQRLDLLGDTDQRFCTVNDRLVAATLLLDALRPLLIVPEIRL